MRHGPAGPRGWMSLTSNCTYICWRMIIASGGINICIVPESRSNSKIYEPSAPHHTDASFRVSFKYV
jgi:hypothetical protein